MFLLAIETSSRVGSIAITDGSRVCGERTFSHGLQNAARLLPLIDELCRAQRIAPRDLTDIAVSIGPGSFTGLRIGVTLAKTLAFSIRAKLIAVPSMPVIALNVVGDQQYIMPILDAKRDQVFAAVYRRQDHRLDEVLAPQLAHLPDLLARSPRPLAVIGEGIKYQQQHLGSQISDSKSQISDLRFQISDLRSQISLAPEEHWYPRAATVARLAMQLKEHGQLADPFKLTPLYIRKPEAQERMEAGLLKHLEG